MGLSFHSKETTSNQHHCKGHGELQWNPDFSNLQGKRKLVGKIREFEKWRVKLQCLTEGGKLLLVEVVKFEKLRVREIGIPL